MYCAFRKEKKYINKINLGKYKVIQVDFSKNKLINVIKNYFIVSRYIIA